MENHSCIKETSSGVLEICSTISLTQSTGQSNKALRTKTIFASMAAATVDTHVLLVSR